MYDGNDIRDACKMAFAVAYHSVRWEVTDSGYVAVNYLQ